jgi:hypothetical protein
VVFSRYPVFSINKTVESGVKHQAINQHLYFPCLFKGVPQLVLLTKIDRVCEITGEDLSQVFHSQTIQETVDRVSQIMGLPRSHILPIKNYELEIDVNDYVNILALLSLQQMFHFADDFMYNYLDQLEDAEMQELNKLDLIGTIVMLTICLCIVTWFVL